MGKVVVYWPNQPEPNPFTAVLNNSQTTTACRTGECRRPSPTRSVALGRAAKAAIARTENAAERAFLRQRRQALTHE